MFRNYRREEEVIRGLTNRVISGANCYNQDPSIGS